ncbi:MAG: (Fe-S)-binding protein [Chloroflexi bacterium]|nr:(Fe-S)-binding protein [Chloroflexota bacterium]
MNREAVQRIVRAYKAYLCLECGKCTSVCPVAWLDSGFSPRLTVERVLLGQGDEVVAGDAIWACLTCGLCSHRCPSDVGYVDFIRELRVGAREEGREGGCTHGGVMEALSHIMSANLRQNRLDWLDGALETAERGPVLYFTGCLPYYEVLFSDLGAEGVNIARAAVRVLNRLGVRPVLLPDERCCGHDALWTGDPQTFQRLARHNIEMLNDSGAEVIVTTCPECYRTLAVDYPAHVAPLRAKVMHLSEFVAPRLGELSLRPLDFTVTYQDPCRLGRFMGVYDAPRQVLNAMGVRLVEMAHSGQSALCCGTSAWIHCGAVSKAMQVNRLTEARNTGADLLVTACVKCQIHFRCALADEDAAGLRMPVRDLTTLLAEALGG